jgi:Tol biopolymer transport system component
VAARFSFKSKPRAQPAAKHLRRAGSGLVALALAGCAAGAASIHSPKRLVLVYRDSGEAFLAAARSASAPRALGDASQALLSPDGTSVLALSTGPAQATLTLYGTGRHSSARVVLQLAAPRFAPDGARLLSWSPDSRYVALTANELSAAGEQSALLVLDVRSGQIRTIATGDFLGASFAPALPDRLVYSSASVAQLDDGESLLYETSAGGGRTRELTRAGLASAPVWGARGIVFAKLLRLGSRSSSPLYALWQIAPSGRGLHRIGAFASGPPDANSSGAAFWLSADGDRLVGNFYSPDSLFRRVDVWALNLAGRRRSPVAVNVAGATVLAEGISRNGKTILLREQTQGAREIVALAWNGARQSVLATSADEASWNH